MTNTGIDTGILRSMSNAERFQIGDSVYHRPSQQYGKVTKLYGPNEYTDPEGMTYPFPVVDVEGVGACFGRDLLPAPEGKRYAKVGDLVIHKRSGEIGKIVEVHRPNEYRISDRPVSCPVVVLDSGTPFLDVPVKTLFDFLPNEVEPKIVSLRATVDACVMDVVRVLCENEAIEEKIAMLVVGSVIRERLRKEK